MLILEAETATRIVTTYQWKLTWSKMTSLNLKVFSRTFVHFSVKTISLVAAEG